MKALFDHVVIVGCGLLGTSLGMGLRERGLAGVVTGVGREGSRSAEVGRERGGFDRVSYDVGRAVGEEGGADLVVFCVPVRGFVEGFKAVAGKLKEGVIVTDVGSTKGEVMKWAGEILPREPKAFFVGSHPMAGSEKSGPEAAREDLYEGAVCLMCSPYHYDVGRTQRWGGGPGESESVETAEMYDLNFMRVKSMWAKIGMKVIDLPAEMHDRWVAMVSHLPHAVAFSLMNVAGRKPEMLEAVAGGFLDTTRVAGSDVAMWTDIFLTNKEAVVGAIGAFEGELGRLKEMVKAGDEKGIREMLMAARVGREGLMARRRAAGLSVGLNGGIQPGKGEK